MKILINKTSSLGDIIHAFPVIAYLREKIPNSTIDWTVEKPFASLIDAHPDVDRSILINTRVWRRNLFSLHVQEEMKSFYRDLKSSSYDVVFDLQGNTKSGVVTYLSQACHKVGFAKPVVPEILNIFATDRRFMPPKGKNIRDDYLYLVQSYFNDVVPFSFKGVKLNISTDELNQVHDVIGSHPKRTGPKIMVCPGSAWINKQMSEEFLQDFLQRIAHDQDPAFFFVWGTDDERYLVETLSSKMKESSLVLKKMPLPVLQRVMGEVDLVIAMDSLPLHLAGTTATPTYSIFGPSSAKKYCPVGNRHHAFQGYCPYGQSFEKRCDLLRSCQTGNCIKKVSGVTLFEHFTQCFPLLSHID